MIEIENLIDHANIIAREKEERGQAIDPDGLPIVAIVRSPAVAIRYSLQGPPYQWRRIQMRFTTSADYETVVNHLRFLGLHMRTQPARPQTGTTAATTHVSGNHGSVFSFPNLQIQELRPQTAGMAVDSYSPCPSTFDLSKPVPLEYTNTNSLAFTSPSTPRYEQHHLCQSDTAGLPESLQPPQYLTQPSSSSSRPSSSSSQISPVRSLPSGLTSFEKRFPKTTSSSVFADRPATCEGTVPPRRQLPFEKPSTPVSSGSDSHRPGSASMPPPLRPASSYGDSRTVATARAIGDAIDFAPLPRPTPVQKRARSSSNTSVGISCDRPPSPLSSNVRGNLHESSTTPPLSSHDRAASIEDGFNTSEARVLAAITATTEANTRGLAEYASLSNQQRALQLNNFILQHLEDDNFLALAQDMEVCWGRLALR
ncbi:hypothetical protein BS50DRAFT_569130 [Corynespora cassiicola Philippines]|uniref:Uncharacterized protein n=1 Tax=Corynespora cassiicola Philippines TaxID=1448308 RepID=A0A2T2P7I3_CORCC|nr:hypothetical protein BS50DRAFT_569130 [Corynespora cassiicola Philippines]